MSAAGGGVGSGDVPKNSLMLLKKKHHMNMNSTAPGATASGASDPPLQPSATAKHNEPELTKVDATDATDAAGSDAADGDVIDVSTDDAKRQQLEIERKMTGLALAGSGGASTSGGGGAGPGGGGGGEMKEVIIWKCNSCAKECFPVTDQSWCLCGHRNNRHDPNNHYKCLDSKCKSLFPVRCVMRGVRELTTRCVAYR